MERNASRASILAWGLGLLLVPWLGGGTAPLALFIDLAVLSVMTALLANDGLRLPRLGAPAWWYLGLLGWGTVSLFWSVNRFQTVMWLMLLVIGGATYVVSALLAQNEGVRQRLIDIYLGVAGLTAIWGLVIYLTDPYERLTGPFYLANPAAAFLLPAVVLSVQRALRTKSSPWTILAGLLAGAVMLADSRTIFLIVIAAAVAVAMTYPKAMARASRRMVVIAVIAVVLVVGSNAIRTSVLHYSVTSQPGARFAEVAEGRSTSGSDRIYFLRSAAAIWKQHPLVGSGAGTFATEHPHYQIRVISASAHVHNLYAETLAELGLVGFGLVVGFVCSILWLLISNYRNRVHFVLSLVIAVILMHFAVDIESYFPVMIVVLALLLGVAYPVRQSETSTKARAFIWLIPVGLVALAGLSYSQVRAYSHHNLARYYSADGEVSTAEEEENESINKIFFDPDYVTQAGIYLYSTTAVMNEQQKAAAIKHALALAAQAERSDPDDSQHYQFEGRVQILADDSVRAEAAFKHALSLDPYNHPDYAADLAGLYQKQGKTAEALKVATAMLAQYPMTVVSNRSTDQSLVPNLANLNAIVATIKLGQGDTAGATAAVAAGLKLDPSNLRCRALEHQLAATAK